MNRYPTFLLLALLILAPGLSAPGNVFWRWHLASGQAVFDATPGWQRVYQSQVRVNDSQGRLEIINCADPLPEVMATLERAFPAGPGASFRQSESSSWGLVQTEATTTRILALTLGLPGQTTLFVLTQSAAEYTRSLEPPAIHQLDAAPVYPGSVARTFLADEQSSAQLEISSASGGPAAIHDFFATALAQQGYRPLSATGGRGPADSRLAIFQKGQNVCCILVQASPPGREAMITVLHKHLKME